jgi:hypothetical protein
MTTLGWDHPPSVPAPALDHNGEPLGYGLSSDLTYEQPPMLIAQVDGPQPTGALPTTQASAGFVISLVGWPRLRTFPVLTMPLIATGVVLSASTLTNCRRGVSAGRKRALAGFVLGIVGIFVTLIAILDFINGTPILVPQR